ncbi:unnamed protein product [Caenorhabditis brenneri]
MFHMKDGRQPECIFTISLRNIYSRHFQNGDPDKRKCLEQGSLQLCIKRNITQMQLDLDEVISKYTMSSLHWTCEL